MTFWISCLRLLDKKAKVIVFLLLLAQCIFFYHYFFVSPMTHIYEWGEILFGLKVVTPWILPMTLYLNFKMLPLDQTFIQIRSLVKERSKKTFIIVVMNSLLSIIIPLFCAILDVSHYFSLKETILIIFCVIGRWMFFLWNVSLVQCIGMSQFKNKSIWTIFVFVFLFVLCNISKQASYLCVLFLTPVYNYQLTLPLLLLTIGYAIFLPILYIHLEEKRELL